MTTKLEQAARQALEALEVSTDWDVGAKGKQLQSMKAITALREALANPEERGTNRYEGWVEVAEQEPVAEVVVRPLRGNQSLPTTDVKWLQRPKTGKLYAAPVRTKDLTPDEIAAVVREAVMGSAINRDGSTSHRIARAVIAADRKLNGVEK